MARPEHNALNEVTVLVTRPEYQQQNLVNLIEREGGTADCFATLEITATEQQSALEASLRNLDSFDIAIFVSPNAARFVFETLQTHGLELPNSIALACVGKGCSAAIEAQGYKADAIPVHGIGSEGLLKHDLLQSVEGKRIVIFRGDGGRELLADTLRQRGAHVEYTECYRRRVPDANPDKLVELIERWLAGKINIVTITSSQAFTNLWALLGDKAETLIPSIPMVVLSERIAQTAHAAGCKNNIMVSNDTSDRAIVDTIIQWRKQWRLRQKTL